MIKILLHVCCAPCSTHSIEALMKEYSVVLFFSNSNIFPQEEYEKRLENARKIASVYGLELIEDIYDHTAWLSFIKGLEDEPEKGKRCEKCFEFNLARAAQKADELGIDHFTTTLTISPHKDSIKIFEIGRRLSDKFLEINFKKKDGFKHSLELSDKHELYRQEFCGCEFSR
ncbi:MAG: epoxyqueuosine reductase QueH [Nanoarchaeota archaeon]|nr:epoxyqueuosine reductase QueH [Nanoarchaeota archaeon]MBU1704117.1 epoxyqueuosine reductase QueH [Nanoarchaeota archaeon]